MEEKVLERIKFYLSFKHWSVYRLAKESGLSYSSLNNLFNRNSCPSIYTLSKICQGLNINLSEFFNFESNPLKNDDLSDKEQDIVNSYRVLSAKDKELLTAYINGLCKR